MKEKQKDKENDRLVFLREFIKELIINSGKEGKEISESLMAHEEFETAETSKFVPSLQPSQIQITPLFETENKPEKFTEPISFAPRILEVTREKMPRGIGEVSLGKIDIFLHDPQIMAIECTGPGKFLLVRKFNQINVTKISLSSEEIKEIIEKFSREARIPIIGGIFRAAVRNLRISAVLSEVAGDRFVVTKYSPYSMLEK